MNRVYTSTFDLKLYHHFIILLDQEWANYDPSFDQPICQNGKCTHFHFFNSAYINLIEIYQVQWR